METLNAIFVIGLGVAFGLILLQLIEAIVNIPHYLSERRKQQRFMDGIKSAMDEAVQFMQSDEFQEQLKKGKSGARNNSKAVKKTRQSTRTATTAQAQKVSVTKKGVQNGRQKQR